MISVAFVVDDPANLLTLRHELRMARSDWDMRFLPTTEDALIALQEKHFDVIVAALDGETLSGAELLALVQYQHPRMVRILLAEDGEDDVVAKSAGVAHRILRKSCRAKSLHASINRVVSLERSLRDPDLQSIIGQVGDLPRPNDSVMRLNDLMASDDVSVEAVSAAVASDVNMTAKALQLVNSAYFGLGHQVVDVYEAVMFLGVDTVRDVVVANELIRTFETMSPAVAPCVDELHEHALVVAHLARELAGDRTTAGKAYVAALLHDVGLLLIASRMPEKFLELRIQVSRGNLALREVEEEVIGTHLSELGAHLLDMWGLPAEIVEAVACHHEALDVPADELDVLHLVHVADVLAGNSGEGSWKCGGELPEHYLQSLGLAERVARVGAVA